MILLFKNFNILIFMILNIEGSNVNRELFDTEFSKWKNELNIPINEIDNNNIIISNNEGVYVGNISSDGKRSGLGLTIKPNNDIHFGLWNNDLREGKGIYYSNNGTRFIGNYKNNIMADGLGELLIDDTCNYEGDFINGQFNGYGEMYYLDYGLYNGSWKDGEKDNLGIMYYKNGDIYEGTWYKNKPNGYGKIIYRSGEIYEGQFINGECHGEGAIYYSNGSIFNGYWINGIPVNNNFMPN